MPAFKGLSPGIEFLDSTTSEVPGIQDSHPKR